jgi:hypothetical protein
MGSTERCPHTGEGIPFLSDVFDDDLTRLVACAKEIPLFVRSATLEDPIGFLKPGSKLRIDGENRGDTALVSVPDAPVIPLGPAHFSARTADLAACSPAVGEPRLPR